MQQAVSIIHNGKTLRGMQHIPGRENASAVILFHGFTGSKLEPHRFFLKISRMLEAAGIASFRFDFLGSGESDGDFEEMTVLNELAEAETIFQYVKSHPSIDENKIILLGLSMGGLVASLLAGKLQSQIGKLILLAPAGIMSQLVESLIPTTTFIHSVNAYDVGGNLVGKAFADELKTIDVWNEAAKYKHDVLIIHGTKDEAVPFEVSSMYIENSYGDRATLHPIVGADHTFNSYQWEKEVLDTVISFLEEYKGNVVALDKKGR